MKPIRWQFSDTGDIREYDSHIHCLTILFHLLKLRVKLYVFKNITLHKTNVKFQNTKITAQNTMTKMSNPKTKENKLHKYKNCLSVFRWYETYL